MEYRIETDSMGEIKVENDKYYGAQTKRSMINFAISDEKFPFSLVKSLAIIKYCAAQANMELNKLDENLGEYILKAAQEVIDGKLSDHFPLSVWQTGSGTQSNMNANEVISNRAIEMMGGIIGSKNPIHPNDHVNMSQSSNDTFPTAMHIAMVSEIIENLLPALDEFIPVAKAKSEEFNSIIKIGRTHLQDATPLSLGQEFSAYYFNLAKSRKIISDSLEDLFYLAQGGTAVGTGINSKKGFDKLFAANVAKFTGFDFKTSENKFDSLANHYAIVNSHNAVSMLASNLHKIANDIRLLASGPRSGLGEISLPANEPGSSIMPGKVNPTQCEALTMICAQIMGNNQTIQFANANGHLQLNVYKPVIIYNALQSIRLLSDGIKSFNNNCFKNIKANKEQINALMEKSLMLVTALAPKIGYDNAATIAKNAHKNNTTLKEEAIKSKLISSDEYDKLIVPEKMIKPSE